MKTEQSILQGYFLMIELRLGKYTSRDFPKTLFLAKEVGIYMLTLGASLVRAIML